MHVNINQFTSNLKLLRTNDAVAFHEFRAMHSENNSFTAFIAISIHFGYIINAQIHKKRVYCNQQLNVKNNNIISKCMCALCKRVSACVCLYAFVRDFVVIQCKCANYSIYVLVPTRVNCKYISKIHMAFDINVTCKLSIFIYFL